MVKIYIRKIHAGGMLWTDVPLLWRNEVVKQLEASGYSCNEDGSVTVVEGVEEV